MTDTSPLSTSSPNFLTHLFEADPTSITDDQLLTLITELRRRRSEFTAKEAADKLKTKTPRAKAGTVPAAVAAALDKPVGEVSLDDLL